jgi:hypothetical protein
VCYSPLLSLIFIGRFLHLFGTALAYSQSKKLSLFFIFYRIQTRVEMCNSILIINKSQQMLVKFTNRQLFAIQIFLHKISTPVHASHRPIMFALSHLWNKISSRPYRKESLAAIREMKPKREESSYACLHDLVVLPKETLSFIWLGLRVSLVSD